MPARIVVKFQDEAVQQQRTCVAERVIAYFENDLPEGRLLCFFDDEDWLLFKQRGSENRGCYSPIRQGFPWGDWPLYVKEHILVAEPPHYEVRQIFEDVIYLHGSTCADETALVMTFAHELQHYIQRKTTPTLWAANLLIPNLHISAVSELQLQWSDIPTEREARVVAKRTAEALCGKEAVGEYIGRMRARATKPLDIADWNFMAALEAETDKMDLEAATRRIFQRLKTYRPQLEEARAYFANDPDFIDVNVQALTQELASP